MAFQDFDLIQERRKTVRQQRLRKRITIAVVSFVVIALLAAAAFAALVFYNQIHEKNTPTRRDNKTPPRKAAPEKHEPSKPNASTPAPALEKQNATAPAPVPALEKQNASAPTPAPAPGNVLAPAPGPVADTNVKAVCASTDYPEACQSSLLSALAVNASASEPKDFLKASMSAANEGMDKAITTVNDIKTDDPMKKAALSDCLTLLNDAKDELNSSASSIDGKDMDKLTPELNNWLSAVMSYQETCIDGIPEGEERNKVGQSLEIVKQLTSNSLAMASQASSLPGVDIKRRLLESSEKDGLPTWMDQESRRVLKADLPTKTPNATVAKDGSGNFTTISAALAAIPQSYEGRYYIFVKEGTYEENVIVTKKMVNVTMYGLGSQKSIITGSKNFVDGLPTYQTATFVAEGEGFMAQSLGFKNTAGPEKHQAVALRVKSDRSIFLNCRMEGYQNTLYVQTHRQYYRSCYIIGTVDIIFGDAAAVFQNCDLSLRKPMDDQQNIITAQGRIDKRESTGIVLQNCEIVADETLKPEKAKFKSYLGRPWKEYSRTIVMESKIGDIIDPEGWKSWNETEFGQKTCFYAEFDNKGSGSKVDARVKWAGYHVITKEEAMNFTVGPFLQAESWLQKGSKVPVRFGLFN